ncbi:MAG: PLP-dependent aminotransferase family protein [Sphingomonadales bacterium]|nr:PLP-dependent aminotransferase family protein [Sphingomonadales bacterium]MDE2171888.1 PLP-dependent aminotransferase family protein [Sphingomonadales bacterium]
MTEPQTRTQTVMATIRARIAGRMLGAGDRLPSIRRLATAMGVSPATVVEAYDRLVAEGVIRAVPKSGFFVARRGEAPMALIRIAPARQPEIDPFWVSRQALDAQEDTDKPGCGWLAPDLMPQDALRRALRDTLRAGGGMLTDYGSTLGSLPLRRHLALRFAEEGLPVDIDQIMLTGSGTQAIDLVCRFLLRPGDTVLVDDPCYFNFQALLTAHRARIVSVPYTASGPDLAAFEQVLAGERPRLYITNSAVHNPTGAALSPGVAHRMLALATAAGMTIVEDDIFADFETHPSPRLAVLDGLHDVIRIGSFSKTLSAAARCGYIAARREWVTALVDLQVATSFGGPSPIASAVAAHVLTSGTYRKHMDDLRRRLARMRGEMGARLSTIGVEPWLMPRGGFSLWCRLPQGVDSTPLARRCLDRGVVIAPGNVFSPTQTAAGFMRVNVTHMTDRAFEVLRQTLIA